MTASIRDSHDVTSGDPGWGEAWWWLGFPVLVAISLFALHWYNPEYYVQEVLPEHRGWLEISHFVFPFTGLVLCLRMLWKHNVRSWPLLMAAIIVFALACFYIAGEEESWGQHAFRWTTPEAWERLNRQNETNLHNTSYYLNQLPQSLLQFAIVIGGIILPIVRWLVGSLKPPILAILTPANAILPTAIIAIAFKNLDRLQKHGFIEQILPKPSEATETFFYMFICLYLIMLYRRTRML